jgi:hypothetical protein
VTLKKNFAGVRGELWYIDPTTGAEVYLFSNQDPLGTFRNLPAFPAGSMFTFFYITTAPLYFHDKKYSGPSIPGISTYVNTYNSDANLDPNKRWGYRYCAVGHERTAVGGSLTGNLEFGYEDESDHGPIPSQPWRSWSDMDFNDIIFSATGLQMGIQSRTLASKGLVR